MGRSKHYTEQEQNNEKKINTKNREKWKDMKFMQSFHMHYPCQDITINI